MKLIDEKNYLTVRTFYVFKNGFKSFLKLASVLGSRYESAHVERKYLFILKSRRHVAACDSLRKCLNNRGFTNTGLTDEHGIVLALSGKDPYNISDLCITSDNGIKLLVLGLLDKLCSVFTERIVSSLGVIRRHVPVTSDLGKHL